MSSMRDCAVCGNNKECEVIKFGAANTNQNPVVIMSTQIVAPKYVCSLGACRDCIREKGKTPKTNWLVFWISAIGMIAFTALFIKLGSAPGQNNSVWGIFAVVLLLWMVQSFSGMALIIKGNYEKGKTIGLMMGLFIPVLAPILMLGQKKRINSNAAAIRLLKPVAKERFKAQEETRTEVERKLEQGEEVDAETMKQYKAEEANRQYHEAKAAETARKGNITYALLGMVITLLLLIQGYDVYTNKTGYMQLFGSIKLDQGQFTLVILAFIAYDIFALVSALKHRDK